MKCMHCNLVCAITHTMMMMGLSLYSIALVYLFTSIFSLKNTLNDFLERQSLPEFKELEYFPNDLLMCHVIGTWKEIVQHQINIEE